MFAENVYHAEDSGMHVCDPSVGPCPCDSDNSENTDEKTCTCNGSGLEKNCMLNFYSCDDDIEQKLVKVHKEKDVNNPNIIKT